MIKKLFYSKGRTLLELKKKISKFNIPKTFIFSVQDWKRNKEIYLKKIQKSFKSKIIIRSSSSMEDNLQTSGAGQFLSLLNISSKDLEKVSVSIDKVIKSYQKVKKKVLKEEILIQEMISDVKMSGVIFTGNNSENENFYYTINYDDITGTTDSITSGKSTYSNKTLYIFKKKIKLIRSERFKKIVSGVQEIEKIYPNQNLDIEFCLTKNGKFFLFQVRPVILNNKIEKNFKKEVSNELTKLHKDLKKIFFSPSQQFKDCKTFLSQMSDWNPGEMIGQHPSNLSYSIYDYLITNKNWLISRKIMGYKNFSESNLMFRLCGRPFIDVKKSLMSLTPNNISQKLSQKLINASIRKLMFFPSLHDKIEFELMPTCFTFDLDKRIKKIGLKLNRKEKDNFKKELKNLFLKNFSRYGEGGIDVNLFKIEKLKSLQNEYKIDSKISDIPKILNSCIKYGIIPFAILARHAFISKEILNSLTRTKAIDKNFQSHFENNIKTITSEFLEDQNLIGNSKLKYKKFIKKYGHLRPGTYDIKSKTYNNINKNNFYTNNLKISKLKKTKNKSLKFSSKINVLIKKNKLNISPDQLFNYFQKSIQAREYSKFIFSKSISIVLEKIKKNLSKKNILLKDMDNLSIEEILKEKKLININKKIRKNFYKRRLFEKIKLPEIVVEPENAFIGATVSSIPNFVTTENIICESHYLSSTNNNLNISNKIVLIESADPGFDWIFSKNIKGLITKFGGANSHMTIRCTELKIPAAIGCGENLFNKLSKASKINLNCENKIIRTIDQNYANN